jgi:hypothetical protein
MAREIEFYAFAEEVDALLSELFDRGARINGVVEKAGQKVVASSLSDNALIECESNLKITIPEISKLPPIVKSVFNKPSNSTKHYFLHNVGGPFLELEVPRSEKVGHDERLFPGAFSMKSDYFVDETYLERIPMAALKREYAKIARKIRSKFAKHTAATGRAWFISPRVIDKIRSGTAILCGPLEGKSLHLD